jgi:hypothetical protein
MTNSLTIRTFWLASVLCLSGLLLAPTSALAQKSQIKSPKPLPQDITPRVAENQCGGFTGHFGPLDFRSAHNEDRRVVESYHFDMEYATFMKGEVAGRNRAGTANVAGGFQYTLKAIPNHPTALYAMERLGMRLNSERPQDTEFPLECWYVRAFKIAPDDPMVRALYGIYLANRGRKEEALHNLKIADEELPSDANMQYNIGLTYFKLNQFEAAQLSGMRAARQGFKLDGLEHMLKKAGKWNPQLTLPVEKDDESEVPASAKAKTETGTETEKQ